MIVYNVTIKVPHDIEKEWLDWQRNVHIPEVMASGKFTSYKFYRLLQQDEEDGKTYIVQYYASSMESYNQYIEQTAPSLRKSFADKWNNQLTLFRTIMEVVN